MTFKVSEPDFELRNKVRVERIPTLILKILLFVNISIFQHFYFRLKLRWEWGCCCICLNFVSRTITVGITITPTIKIIKSSIYILQSLRLIGLCFSCILSSHSYERRKVSFLGKQLLPLLVVRAHCPWFMISIWILFEHF
jgi:hypothetical protein